MIYYANGGFNWHDLYFMPISLREFYWKQLLDTKNKEKEQHENALNKSNGRSPTKIKRK